MDERWQKLHDLIQARVVNVVKPAHRNDEHRYRFRGQTYKSVTTISGYNDNDYAPWRENEAKAKARALGITAEVSQQMFDAYKEKLDHAVMVGNRTHEYLDKYLRDWIEIGASPGSVKVSDKDHYEVVSCVRAGINIIKELGVRPLASELIVGHEHRGTGGTVDAVMMNKRGEVEVWDWKTAVSIKDIHAVQSAVYADILERMTGFRVSCIRIVKLPRNGQGARVYEVDDREAALKYFEAKRVIMNTNNLHKEYGKQIITL